MDSVRLKLVLALLWAIPAAAMLGTEAWTGRSVAVLPLGTARLSLSWTFTAFAVLNLVRWWYARSARRSAGEWRSFRDRQRQREREGDSSVQDPADR